MGEFYIIRNSLFCSVELQTLDKLKTIVYCKTGNTINKFLKEVKMKGLFKSIRLGLLIITCLLLLGVSPALAQEPE